MLKKLKGHIELYRSPCPVSQAEKSPKSPEQKEFFVLICCCCSFSVFITMVLFPLPLLDGESIVLHLNMAVLKPQEHSTQICIHIYHDLTCIIRAPSTKP